MKKLVVMTGAGISAESGIKTFRDADGLWEGHDVMEVASPEGWAANQALVLDFYNQRRKQLKEVQPNKAHHLLAELEAEYNVTIITQNVDNLHERAGSTKIIHLHGELTKVRSVKNENDIQTWTEDLNLGDLGSDGAQLRPHIVWFGEAVPMLGNAAQETMTADIVIIIGTSMQVYPAASLVSYAPAHAQIYYVDPKPTINYELGISDNLEIISEIASTGLAKAIDKIKKRVKS